MLYLLPTRSPVRYTGKHPNRLRSWSTGGRNQTDRDGKRCVHFETQSGERYTCSYDRLDIKRIDSTRTMLGTVWTEFVKNGTVVTTMTQEQYDEWLTSIRRERELARAAVEARRV